MNNVSLKFEEEFNLLIVKKNHVILNEINLLILSIEMLQIFNRLYSEVLTGVIMHNLKKIEYKYMQIITHKFRIHSLFKLNSKIFVLIDQKEWSSKKENIMSIIMIF